MAAPIRFPYTLVRGRREPIIALGLRLPLGWQRVDFYADSGAAYSIVSVQLALAAGFDFKQGERTSIQVGDGDCLPVYLHRLPLQIGARLLQARVGFAERYGLHFNLLGRLDVFENFNISFREHDGVILFEPVEEGALIPPRCAGVAASGLRV
jgi:hypothetical protein